MAATPLASSSSPPCAPPSSSPTVVSLPTPAPPLLLLLRASHSPSPSSAPIAGALFFPEISHSLSSSRSPAPRSPPLAGAQPAAATIASPLARSPPLARAQPPTATTSRPPLPSPVAHVSRPEPPPGRPHLLCQHSNHDPSSPPRTSSNTRAPLLRAPTIPQPLPRPNGSPDLLAPPLRSPCGRLYLNQRLLPLVFISDQRLSLPILCALPYRRRASVPPSSTLLHVRASTFDSSDNSSPIPVPDL